MSIPFPSHSGERGHPRESGLGVRLPRDDEGTGRGMGRSGHEHRYLLTLCPFVHKFCRTKHMLFLIVDISEAHV